MILGAIWNMKQNGGGYDSMVSYDQSRELASIDASICVLDLCGQRNAFARRYSVLIKDLRQNLKKHMLDVTSGVTSSGLALTHTSSLNSPFYNPPLSSPPSNLSTPTTESQAYQNLDGAINSNGGTSTPPLHDANRRPSIYSSTASTNIAMEPWSEHFGIFYPTNDASSHGALYSQ